MVVWWEKHWVASLAVWWAELRDERKAVWKAAYWGYE